MKNQDLKDFGQRLEALRKEKGMTRKDVAVALGKRPDDDKWLDRYEKAERRPSRNAVVSLLLTGLRETNTATVNLFLQLAGYEGLSQDELVRFQLAGARIPDVPRPQIARWGPADGKPAGILLDNGSIHIPWNELKMEIEQRLLNQIGRHIPVGCSVALDEFKGRKSWLVRIVGPNKERLGYVWFGSDPEAAWSFDGLVRVGDAVDDYTAVVWQVFQRYADGSYRRIEARLPKH